MSNFTYGLEFEVEGISPNAASDALNENGISCDRVRENIHETSDYWKAVYDGSLNNGAEVVSPILNDRRLNEASIVANALKHAGARVGRSTGFHVHIGADVFGNASSGESESDVMARFLLNYYSAHHAVGALVAPSRLRNHFCRILNRADAEGEAESLRNGARGSRWNSRYYSLNLESLRRHNTLEIRLHQGTLNGVKAIAWTQFLASMIHASKRGDDFGAIDGFEAWQTTSTASVEQCRVLLRHLVDTGSLKPSAGDWLAKRASRLNP